MTVETTVKNLLPSATTEQIQIYLTLVEQADSCLENYPAEVADLAKALAIAHMLTLNGGGQVTSESTRTGASASYAVNQGKGILSTNFGQQLAALPAYACLKSFIGQPERFARSIKPCR